MSHAIRPAVHTDTPELAALIHEIGYFSRINSEPPEATAEFIARELALCLRDSSHSIFVCEDEAGRLLGYASVHYLPYLIHTGPEAYLSELFVRPDARDQRVGSALLERATSEARARGCERMSLINMRNRESYQRDFYKKHGWEERELAANFVLPLK